VSTAVGRQGSGSPQVRSDRITACVRQPGRDDARGAPVRRTFKAITRLPSMLNLDANRRGHRVPLLAQWCLDGGIVATVGVKLAHGLGHGPVGALISAWAALALADSFELFMTLIRPKNRAGVPADSSHPAPPTKQEVPPAPNQEQAIRTRTTLATASAP
jgi:hypothetical protein